MYIIKAYNAVQSGNIMSSPQDIVVHSGSTVEQLEIESLCEPLTTSDWLMSLYIALNAQKQICQNN